MDMTSIAVPLVGLPSGPMYSKLIEERGTKQKEIRTKIQQAIKTLHRRSSTPAREDISTSVDEISPSIRGPEHRQPHALVLEHGRATSGRGKQELEKEDEEKKKAEKCRT
jgi:hypothetical protein